MMWCATFSPQAFSLTYGMYTVKKQNFFTKCSSAANPALFVTVVLVY